MFKKIRTWKTVIQFIITVLTAVVSSFLTQSCMNCHTDLTDLTDTFCFTDINRHTDLTDLSDALCYNFGNTDLTDLTDAFCYNFGHTDLTDLTDLEYDTMDSFVHVFLAKINK